MGNAFVCGISGSPIGILCINHDENAHPSEDSLGQRWTAVGRQKYWRRQKIVPGLSPRSGRLEKQASGETIFWGELQKKWLAYLLKCFAGINVYSCLLASVRRRESGTVICLWELRISSIESAGNLAAVNAAGTPLSHKITITTYRQWHTGRTLWQFCNSYNLGKKQQMVVANWVGEIRDQPTLDEWKHVKGILNPADTGTRRVNVSQLLESVWLKGPGWLKQDPNN